ncbi:Rab3 GTPase-activating protein catalytic subunit isoform X1, partial [Tanacetum coccineum]
MVCGAFRTAANTLNLTNFGGLKNMTTKIDQLYLTIASALRPLQGENALLGCHCAPARIPSLIEKLLSASPAIHLQPRPAYEKQGLFQKFFPSLDLLDSDDEPNGDESPKLRDVLVDTMLSLLPQLSAPMRSQPLYIVAESYGGKDAVTLVVKMHSLLQ